MCGLLHVLRLLFLPTRLLLHVHVVRLVIVVVTVVITVHASWVDLDSPLSAHRIHPFTPTDRRSYRLVFSDEFNQEGRTFRDGEDPRWTAEDKNDDTNNPLHYYSHNAIQTSDDGRLEITTDIAPKNFTNVINTDNDEIVETKEIRSGMLSSWNKVCFIGGIMEVSVQLPGDPTVGGLWPAVWMMGNLARATYVNSTEGVWPFSTNACNNVTRTNQRINRCHATRGRGAPEIDFLEVMYMDSWGQAPPLLSASLQIAPGKEEGDRLLAGQVPNDPNDNNITWYNPQIGPNSEQNRYFYGVKTRHVNSSLDYQTDAISVNHWLDDSFYQQQKQHQQQPTHHTFRIEWEPPALSDGTGGYIRWYIDKEFIAGVTGEDLQRVSDTEIPSEPMYLLANVAVSKDWGMLDASFLNCSKKCWSCLDPDCAACGALPPNFCSNFPARMTIDHVRVYQAINDPQHQLGCSPPSRPTKEWIDHVDHVEDYKLPHQAQPLLPIARGGAPCVVDTDCGGTRGLGRRGTCSAEGTCQCEMEWTGPKCLAHAGFYEEPSGKEKVTFNTVVIIGLLLLLLFVVLTALVKTIKSRTVAQRLLQAQKKQTKQRSKYGQYRALPDADATSDASFFSAVGNPSSSSSSDHSSVASYQKEEISLSMH